MLGRLPPRIANPLSCSSQSPKPFLFGKFASTGGSTNTSSVIGVCMNATLKSALSRQRASGLPRASSGSPLQLVLVYPRVHWDLFLLGTVEPQTDCALRHLSVGNTIVLTTPFPSSDGRTVHQHQFIP